MEEVSHYLGSLGDREVLTDAGVLSAKDAAKLVLTGSVREVVVFGGPVIKIERFRAFSSAPLPLPGTSRADLTYSRRELQLLKLADLLAAMGIESTAGYRAMLSDPLALAAAAVEAYENERKRGSPLAPQIKSSLLNLLDILSDIVYAKEGDRVDTVTSAIKRYEKTGELEELSDHAKHRLHATRTLIRFMSGTAREVYKTFVESGRHYVIVFDRSGSMGERYMNTTKKAVASLIAFLIGKADPEARYSLVAFDATAKVLAVRKELSEIADTIVEVEPAGGTSYPAGLKAASKILSEGDVLVVVGDFEDGKRVPQEVADGIRAKASKVLLLPVGESNIEYAEYLAKTLNGEIYVYKAGTFLKL